MSVMVEVMGMRFGILLLVLSYYTAKREVLEYAQTKVMPLLVDPRGANYGLFRLTRYPAVNPTTVP